MATVELPTMTPRSSVEIDRSEMDRIMGLQSGSISEIASRRHSLEDQDTGKDRDRVNGITALAGRLSDITVTVEETRQPEGEKAGIVEAQQEEKQEDDQVVADVAEAKVNRKVSYPRQSKSHADRRSQISRFRTRVC